ncbi:MAG: hypothetical protein JXL97_13320 [Bacteroidales bacterium]|nr:hypothetical protein [Bacteroidales bacterium]
MSQIWEKFIELHNGPFLARDSFEELCYDVLDTHYPGRSISTVSDLEKLKPKNLTVVFTNKLFIDELTNSRKGQIRKGFKKFLAYKKASKLKTYAWVFCVSYTLTNDEMMWWINWKTKTSKEHGVDIQLLDGEYIIELAKKYNLYEKWFTKSDEKKSSIMKEENKNEDNFSFELIPDNHKKEELKKEELKNEEPKNEEPKNEEPKNEELKNEELKNEEIIDKTQIISPAQKILFEFKFENFKSEFKRIKNFADKLSKEEKDYLKEINSHENWEKLFELKEDLDTTTLKLFYKAKSYEVRKRYIQATYVYEEILKKDNYREVLKFKLEDSYKSLKKCQNKIQGYLYELEGDVYFVRENQIKSIELYEKCHKLDKTNKIYARKFYETLGDNQIENELPEDALISFKYALENDKTNEELEIKLLNAKHLTKGKKFFKTAPLTLLNVFFSPFAYWAANSTIKDPKTQKKLNTSSKKFFYSLALLLLLVAVVFFAFKITPKTNKISKNAKINMFENAENMIKPKSLEQAAIEYGDNIMSNISWDKIHLVDTAIFAYKRALVYNSSNNLAYSQLKIAETYKKEYVSKVQANILLDSASYFVSMRRPSEGLQLFKYLFKPNDKSGGKYGYVDTNMQIVIAPMYDFNYRRMYNGNENFVNGKALICLVHSQGDTNYYKIDKYNHLKSRL